MPQYLSNSQAQGRPFGDVSLALLATERMALVTGAICTDSWSHQLQVGRGGSRGHACGLAFISFRGMGVSQFCPTPYHTDGAGLGILGGGS